VTAGLFRVTLPDGTVRVARGDTDSGPAQLLAPEITMAGLLHGGRMALTDAVHHAEGSGSATGTRILAPVDAQEIWAAGVTYERSREARMEESAAASVYDLVYEAERPELFFKAPAWRVRAVGQPIAIRADSGWDVPEPELAVVISADLSIAGYTIGNDVSSRTIEGDNPLYLPQAKIYDGSCALGPCIVPADAVHLPLAISLEVVRDGAVVTSGETSTARLHRSIEGIVEHLGRALTFPDGVLLLTGTGIVPDPGFTLRAGDVVRITIEGLGLLENAVEVVGSTG
jgi:2-dehydro-3-deoxy-D-arabinonate dehydratase